MLATTDNRPNAQVKLLCVTSSQFGAVLAKLAKWGLVCRSTQHSINSAYCCLDCITELTFKAQHWSFETYTWLNFHHRKRLIDIGWPQILNRLLRKIDQKGKTLLIRNPSNEPKLWWRYRWQRSVICPMVIGDRKSVSCVQKWPFVTMVCNFGTMTLNDHMDDRKGCHTDDR